eukprot:12553937-Alexandrium_andersonii.AAC.1
MDASKARRGGMLMQHPERKHLLAVSLPVPPAPDCARLLRRFAQVRAVGGAGTWAETHLWARALAR